MKDRSTGYMPRNYTSDRRERHSLLAVQLEGQRRPHLRPAGPLDGGHFRPETDRVRPPA